MVIVGWKLMSAMAVALGLLRPCPRWDEPPLPWAPPPEVVCPLVAAGVVCEFPVSELVCVVDPSELVAALVPALP